MICKKYYLSVKIKTEQDCLNASTVRISTHSIRTFDCPFYHGWWLNKLYFAGWYPWIVFHDIFRINLLCMYNEHRDDYVIRPWRTFGRVKFYFNLWISYGLGGVLLRRRQLQVPKDFQISVVSRSNGSDLTSKYWD